MEKYLTTSEARQMFLSLIDQVQKGNHIIVTKRGIPAAAIINFEDLQTLKAVARLWQDPEALRAMQESMSDLKKGKVLRLTGTPDVRQILTVARKKGFLGG